MATQVGAIRVQIGSQTPKVQSISYGAKALRGSTDLIIGAATAGDVISYAANGNFVVSNSSSLISNLDAGTF
jgi:hypothetical protein